MESARAIFTWVASHISYDTEAYFGKKRPLVSDVVSVTLATGKSLCSGYAALFHALSELAGLEVATIPGHCKGYGYSALDEELTENHDWNAVKLEGEWRLIDVTWGSGYIDENRVFRSCFDDFFFLTPPHYFIFNHFPSDPAWQLLRKPIDPATYRGIVKVHAPFFEYGLRPLNYPRASIETNKGIKLLFEAKRDFELIARLERMDLAGGASSLPFALGQREGGIFAVYCEFPANGDYSLCVYGRDKGAKGSFRPVLEYAIRARSCATRRVALPETFDAFTAYGVELIEPKEGYLKRGFRQSFRIRAPEAGDVAVVSGSEWTHLLRKGELFEGSVFVKAGEITVYAQYSNQAEYAGLLSYRS